MQPTARTGWTRRRFIAAGVTAGAAIVAGGLELVDRGDLPGRHVLEEFDGACDVTVPGETFAAPGPTVTGRFYSRARRRKVGYAIAYPPGHGPGARLALGVFLYPDGGNHTTPIAGLTLARVLAGHDIAPLALVCCDGGEIYWNPHPGDDPLAMLLDEVLPMCRRQGLGRAPGSVGALGISMGGYGALLLGETAPERIAAVAAISPAVWRTYAQARAVNAAAFASAADFARDDVIAHAPALRHTPVRIASGTEDPFHPGVMALARRLGAGAEVTITPGCHDADYFASQQHRSLQFLARHVTA